MSVRMPALWPGPLHCSAITLLQDDGTGVGIPEGYSPPTVPLGRLAEAVEVAKLVLFLASEEASYCSGGEYTVDGGMTASQSVRSTATAPAPAPVTAEPVSAQSRL